jgi:hypothetical protein
MFAIINASINQQFEQVVILTNLIVHGGQYLTTIFVGM